MDKLLDCGLYITPNVNSYFQPIDVSPATNFICAEFEVGFCMVCMGVVSVKRSE